MNLGVVLENLGLGAALVGVLCGMRGWWPEVAGCGTLVIVCTVLAAVWDPPHRTTKVRTVDAVSGGLMATPQNRGKQGVRTAAGRFPKGVSGNPGGRGSTS